MIALQTAFLIGPAPATSAGAADSPVASQLRSLGFDVVDATGGIDLAAAIRTSAPGRIAVADYRFVGHTHVLRQTAVDPRAAAAAAPGVLAVAPEHRAELAQAIGLAAPSGPGELDLNRVASDLEHRVDLRRIHPAPLVAAIATSPEDREALAARVDAVDEEQVRLKQAVKADDTFFTAMTVRRYSGQVASWLARLGISPNLVTVCSLAVALVAAGLAATGDRVGYVAAAVLFHVAFALDCIDGDLARYTLQFSRLGSWLDATFDRIKEYVLFAGLAVGAIRSDNDVMIWAFAAAAMALQTIRHQMHFAYEEVSAGPDEAPLLSAEVRARLSGARWKVWLRRAVVLPQGERSALICLLVAFTTPKITFVTLLVAGILAGLYGTAGRLLRSLKRLHRGWSRLAAQALGAMVDVGPVGWILHFALPGRSLPAPLTVLVALIFVTGGLLVIPSAGVGWLPAVALWYALLVGFASRQPLNGWADWVLPPSFRTAEYAVVLVPTILLAPEALPAAFAYIAVSAYHQYDTVYRLRGAGTAPARWLVIATGGHDGRILLLSLLAIAGPAVWGIGLIVLAAWLALVFVGESIANTAAWVREAQATQHDELRAPDEDSDGADKRTGRNRVDSPIGNRIGKE